MAAKYFTLTLIVTLGLLKLSNASLLQEALRKGDEKAENDEDIKVEVISEEKSSHDNTKPDSGKSATDNNAEAQIILENVYKPKNCENMTKTGKVAVLHYTGSIGDKIFDSTIDALKRYVPFEFIIGSGAVIKGFETGIKDMCKGEQRKITIPPELGYGEKGAGLIPGNATITYEVQLLDIRDPPPQADVFGAMDGDGDRKLSRDEVGEYMKKQAQMHYGAPMDDYYWSQYHDQMVDNIFAQDDEDEDNHISHEEFSGPKLHHEEL